MFGLGQTCPAFQHAVFRRFFCLFVCLCLHLLQMRIFLPVIALHLLRRFLLVKALPWPILFTVKCERVVLAWCFCRCMRRTGLFSFLLMY